MVKSQSGAGLQAGKATFDYGPGDHIDCHMGQHDRRQYPHKVPPTGKHLFLDIRLQHAFTPVEHAS